MSEYVRETKRGRDLHTIRLNRPHGGTFGYLDITKIVSDAEKCDSKAGYDPVRGGPMQSIEIVRAREWGAYVEEYATDDNIHRFNTMNYHFVSTEEKPE